MKYMTEEHKGLVDAGKKLCWKCFQPADYRASVCVGCGAKLGSINKQGIAKRPLTAFQILSLVFVIFIMIIYIASHLK